MIYIYILKYMHHAAADTLQNVATEYSNIILLYVILIHIWYLNYDILLYTLIHTSRLNSAADTIHYYTYTFITRLNADTIHYQTLQDTGINCTELQYYTVNILQDTALYSTVIHFKYTS